MTAKNSLSVKVTQEITYDNIAYQLDAAMHGCFYWASIDSYVKPENKWIWESMQDNGSEWRFQTYPLSVGGAVLLTADGYKDGETFRLDLESIANGLQLMADQYPKHFADLMAEEGDATTADVFTQMAALGSLVFG